jgi:type II secretory pathway pseudopilin PulG
MILAKTAGSTLIASLAALAVPTFVPYRDRSRVAQALSSSEAILRRA